MAKKLNKGALIFVIIAIVFAIIALPTFLCGCHPDIQPNCLRYYVVNSTVIGNRIDTLTCSECGGYSESCSQSCTGSGTDQQCSQTCTSYCSHYNYYDCYYAYAITSYQLEGEEQIRACDINVVSASTDYTFTNNKLLETYPVGYSFMVYVEKGEFKCFTETNVQSLAITGLVFFCLVGVCMILFAACMFCC